MSLSQLTVTCAEIQNLVPYARNARTHSRRQIRQIADSIRTFGFTNPVFQIENEVYSNCTTTLLFDSASSHLRM
jgi:hypothetical protein